MTSTLSHSDPGLAFRSYSGSVLVKLLCIFWSRERYSEVSFYRSQLQDTSPHGVQLSFGDGSGRYPRGASLEMARGQQVWNGANWGLERGGSLWPFWFTEILERMDRPVANPTFQGSFLQFSDILFISLYRPPRSRVLFSASANFNVAAEYLWKSWEFTACFSKTKYSPFFHNEQKRGPGGQLSGSSACCANKRTWVRIPRTHRTLGIVVQAIVTPVLLWGDGRAETGESQEAHGKASLAYARANKKSRRWGRGGCPLTSMHMRV